MTASEGTDGGARINARRPSYKKQALLCILLLLALAAAAEAVLQVGAQLFPDELCVLMRGDAADNLDVGLKRQICYDHGRIQYAFDDYRLLVPDQHHPTVNINSHGFRGPEFEAEKPEGTYRIFVVGGSSAFGTGTADDATIPAHLERMYRDAGLPFRVEVINAGIPVAQSYAESMHVKERISRMDPDLIIVYDGYNDITNSVDNPGLNERVYGMGEQYGLLREAYLQLQDVIYPLQAARKYSMIIPYLEDSVLGSYSFYDDSPVLPKVAAWKERWSEICGIGGDLGFEVLVTVQPVLGSGNQTMTPYYEAFYAARDGGAIAGKIRHYVDALDDMSTSCPHTLDLTHALDGWVGGADGVGGGGGGGRGGEDRVPVSGAALLDLVHLSDYGNGLIASRMYEASIPIIDPGP